MTQRTRLPETAPCNTGTAACTQLASRTRDRTPVGITDGLGEDNPRRGKQQASTDSYGRYEVFHLWIPSLRHQIHPRRAYSARELLPVVWRCMAHPPLDEPSPLAPYRGFRLSWHQADVL